MILPSRAGAGSTPAVPLLFEPWLPEGLQGGGGVAEWVNPKPEVAVESMDVVGADTGDAALLGITAATNR